MDYFETAPGLPLINSGEVPQYNKNDENIMVASVFLFCFMQLLIHCICKPVPATLYRR